MAGQWDSLAEHLGGVVATLLWGSFVIVEYGLDESDDGPYAQAAPGPAGWYAEVVSDAYVPAADYPVDESRLQVSMAMWRSPLVANWKSPPFATGPEPPRPCLWTPAPASATSPGRPPSDISRHTEA